jgi:hypothetical protein
VRLSQLVERTSHLLSIDCGEVIGRFPERS